MIPEREYLLLAVCNFFCKCVSSHKSGSIADFIPDVSEFGSSRSSVLSPGVVAEAFSLRISGSREGFSTPPKRTASSFLSPFERVSFTVSTLSELPPKTLPRLRLSRASGASFSIILSHEPPDPFVRSEIINLVPLAVGKIDRDFLSTINLLVLKSMGYELHYISLSHFITFPLFEMASLVLPDEWSFVEYFPRINRYSTVILSFLFLWYYFKLIIQEWLQKRTCCVQGCVESRTTLREMYLPGTNISKHCCRTHFNLKFKDLGYYLGKESKPVISMQGLHTRPEQLEDTADSVPHIEKAHVHARKIVTGSPESAGRRLGRQYTSMSDMKNRAQSSLDMH